MRGIKISIIFEYNLKLKTMTQLESTKAINTLKAKAIKKGGYLKFKNEILTACQLHKNLFGTDLTPKHLV